MCVRGTTVRKLTSRYRRAPAQCLTDESTKNGHVRHVAKSYHAIAEDSVDLFVENLLVLRVMAKRETEALHRRGDSQSSSDAVHANSVSAFHVRVELPSFLVLQEHSHP